MLLKSHPVISDKKIKPPQWPSNKKYSVSCKNAISFCRYVCWRVTFEVVDTLTGSSSLAGRPFEEQPHELYRKWKVYTGNDHLRQFNKMFSVGATFGHEQRVSNASTATNVPAPPLYGLRGASNAPNSRLGHFLSRMINHFADCAEESTECKSSEEMKAAFMNFNKMNRESRQKCQILSMDVKALYPSVSWDEIIKSVKWIILKSKMVIEDVNWMEVGKYLAVMMAKEEINEEGLSHVIPKREGEGVRLRNITINCLRQKRNNNKWLPARRPGVRQKQKMLALAVGYGVYTTMSCHTYKVGDEVYQQLGGGSIGLELTGAVARPFMLRWDTLYRDKVRAAGQELDLVMYERYVDDSNQVVITPPPGARYDVVSKKVVIDNTNNNTTLNDDERTARLYTDIANECYTWYCNGI